MTPRVKIPKSFVPDLTHRFFVEDILHGLAVIRSIAEMTSVKTPMIDEILGWVQDLLGEEYLINGKLCGKSVGSLPIAQNYGIFSLQQLVQHAIM
jgi:hypothetical protein